MERGDRLVRPLPDGIGTHRLYAYRAPHSNHRSEKMNREKCFENLKTHPYYGPLIQKMRKTDIKECLEFIHKHGSKSAGDWETAVNRLYIGTTRPKAATLICDILLAIR